MARRSDKEYNRIIKESIALVKSGELPPSFQAIGDYYGIPRTTINQAFRRLADIETSDLQVMALEASPDPENPGHNEFNTSEEGNYLSVETTGRVIKTLEDLIEVCKIDMEIWEVANRPEISSWTTPMKIKQVKIVNEKAVVVEKPIHVVNYRVFARFVRRIPVEITPAIVPVEFVHIPKTKKAKKPTGMNRAILIFDPHLAIKKDMYTGAMTPIHDRRVLDIAQQIMAETGIDKTFIGGDGWDLADFSTKFYTPMEYRNTTQAALVEGREWFIQLLVRKMLQGNHDMRAATAAQKYNNEEAYGLVPADDIEGAPLNSLKRMVGMDSIGVEYVEGYPNNEIWFNDTSRMIHGDKAVTNPLGSSKAIARTSLFNTAYGHTHRPESFADHVDANRGGRRRIEIFCPGCACHIDGRVPGSEKGSYKNWAQGIGIAHYTEDNCHFEGVPINDGIGVFQGQEIEARDRDEEMNDLISDAMKKISENKK